ncbi:MAG: hypothetical protein PHU85_15105, partial [Phycisphaerae bacterium]|nr:hypothetical protein [Phycisphaerae bacterium]
AGFEHAVPPGLGGHWTHLGLVPSGQATQLMRQGDLLLTFMPPGEKEPSGTVTLKAYFYLRTGKPILYVGESGSTGDLLSQFPGTYRLARDEWPRVGDWLQSHEAELRLVDRPGVERYNLGQIAARMSELIFRVVNRPAGQAGTCQERE